jgi:ATP-dependent Clp protease ATP-binding subunit ClpA
MSAPDLPFTPRAKQILQAAIADAQEHNVSCVEPEHILLALTDLADALGYKVLEKLNVSIPQLQQEIQRRMQELPGQIVPQPDEVENQETILKVICYPLSLLLTILHPHW